MLKRWRLDYVDGFEIITAPTLLSSKGVMKSRLIRLYNQELKKAIESCTIWAAEEQMEGVAIALYSHFGYYYSKVAELFSPAVDVERLQWRSRHEFFVATEPVEHPVTGQLLPGLSGVEQLLGMSYSFQQEGEAGEPIDIPGDTGDAELNILTDATLIFKGRAPFLAKILSAEELALACRRANELMKPPEEREAVEVKEKPVEDDPVFIANKERIVEKLREIAIAIPSGF